MFPAHSVPVSRLSRSLDVCIVMQLAQVWGVEIAHLTEVMPFQVNPYEDPESALVRELQEELSIEVRAPHSRICNATPVACACAASSTVFASSLPGSEAGC